MRQDNKAQQWACEAVKGAMFVGVRSPEVPCTTVRQQLVQVHFEKDVLGQLLPNTISATNDSELYLIYCHGLQPFKCDNIYSPQSDGKVWVRALVSQFVRHMRIHGRL